MNVKTATVRTFSFNPGGLQVFVKGCPNGCVIMQKNRSVGWTLFALICSARAQTKLGLTGKTSAFSFLWLQP